MPCFSNPPTPGTREYEEWLPDVRRRLDSFIHVVDYYYGKAGIQVPLASRPENDVDRTGAGEPPREVDADENTRVLHQILLHIDCDGVTFFHLHDMRSLLRDDRTPAGRAYAAVLNHCFGALRNHRQNRPTNAASWLVCDDPTLLLEHVNGKASDRKLRLFAVACCRRVPRLLTDKRSQKAVEVVERYADGAATAEELVVAQALAKSANRKRRADGDSAAACAANTSASEAAKATAWNAADELDSDEECVAQAALFRCIFGNPFCRLAVDPAWRTPTVLSLAQQMYESRDFSAMPILADALQDAGCEHTDILSHCRGDGVHVRGCWVVDLVLANV